MPEPRNEIRAYGEALGKIVEIWTRENIQDVRAQTDAFSASLFARFLASPAWRILVQGHFDTLAGRVARFHREQFSVAPSLDTTRAANTFIETNATLIKDLITEKQAQIAQTVKGAIAQGLRGDAIVQQIQDIADVTQSRAEIIARDQVLKGQAALVRATHVAAGAETYMWITSRDEAVRDTHKANEGQIFRYDAPPAETGNPGDEINCRCAAAPIFPAFQDLDLV